MNSLKDLIRYCHEHHEKPLRQRRTIVTPAPYMGLTYQFTVYCAHRYRVRLYDLEEAEISFMPIGRAPENDRGPRYFGGERFLKRQKIEDWEIRRWHTSWGLQVYTGIPSERNGARWHDFDFKYEALCAAPDAVIACIEPLVNAVANPLLVLSKSGGLRFSCRIPDYLHPNAEEDRLYIHKHSPTPGNPHQRDVYLEILGEKGYSRWDGRYEILLGNLLDPPTVSKEVIFSFIDTLRAVLHEPAPSGWYIPKHDFQSVTVVPPSLGSLRLDLAKEAFMKRGFSYVRQENGSHLWTQHVGSVADGRVWLWENKGTVWIRASTPDAGLPTEATQITDVWDDTGILPSFPAAGSPISDKVLAVRDGKLSPLGIKRPSAVLQKPKHTHKVYETLKESAVQIQRAFEGTARIIGLIAETGTGKSHAVGSYVLSGGAISLNAGFWTVEAAADHIQKRNLPSVSRWRARRFRWNAVKEIPTEERIANPFQHGNVCEDYDRCEALEKKGGNPNESICPQCPVYTACQQHGYLSQPTALKHAKAQISGTPYQFFDPQYSEIVEEILEEVNDTQRLCIIDEVHAHGLFFICDVSENTLKQWCANWQGDILGNFAQALLDALEIKDGPSDNAVGRIRVVMQAFQQHEAELTRQMCLVNLPGKVVARRTVDAETGEELAHFSIEFETGATVHIPLDDNTADKLMANGLPFFQLKSFLPNEDVKIQISMAQAIQLGILDVETVQSIEKFPAVCRHPNWTLWHQLKHFFTYYTRDADAPMTWQHKVLRFWMPPVLHPSVKRLLLMSSTLSEQDLHSVFPDEEIETIRLKPTAWIAGNQVFQTRTGTYSLETLLEYDKGWDVIGVSKTGQRILLGIQAEIERDSSVKHAIIADKLIIEHLAEVAEKENVRFITDFKELELLETAFEEAQIVWIVGTPRWQPGIIWWRAQIQFGNDEKPLNYERKTEPYNYKDERVQSVYEQHVGGLLSRIVGRTGLNRFPDKKVVLITSFPLPDITDRPETLLFDWEDFEVAGGLEKLPEVIATRQRFETERENLNAESSRAEVQRVLGYSERQTTRVLQKLRGVKNLRVPYREQILSLLSDGEKKTAELTSLIEGHPKAINNELTRLVKIGEIVKVRRGVYAIKTASLTKPDT